MSATTFEFTWRKRVSVEFCFRICVSHDIQKREKSNSNSLREGHQRVQSIILNCITGSAARKIGLVLGHFLYVVLMLVAYVLDLLDVIVTLNNELMHRIPNLILFLVQLNRKLKFGAVQNIDNL